MLFHYSVSIFSLFYLASRLPVLYGATPSHPLTLGVIPGKNNYHQQTEKCIKKDTCTCVRKDGTGIDLHFLDAGSKLRFNFSSPRGLFQWNPCRGFVAAGKSGVSVAAGNTQKSLFIYGTQKTAMFSLMDGFDVINYRGDSGTSRIFLQCNKTSEPKILFFSYSGLSVFAVYNGPCTPSGGSSLSNGSVILITFLVLIVVYLTLGCVVNIYIRKAVGFERIPNYEFWKTLPFLIKDGCVFVTRKRPGYQSM